MKQIILTVSIVLCVCLVATTAAYGQTDDGSATTELKSEESNGVLTIVHSSDGESALVADDYSGSVAQFATVVKSIVDEVGEENALVVSSGDNFLAGIEYAASEGAYDGRALSRIGFEVSAIGNHEFDFGPKGLERFMVNANFVFVSSNLDFSKESALRRFEGIRVFDHYIVEKAGRKIGLVGATTEEISYISSPGDNVVIEDVRESLQRSVDRLRAQGIDIIIALTHLQNIEEEKQLATQMEGIDIFVAGGGDDLIGNEGNSYLVRKDREGNDVQDTPTSGYPFYTSSANGEPVVVVSTDGSYNYVGRLDIEFDDQGLISSVDALSGPIPVHTAIEPDYQVQTEIVDLIQKDIARFAKLVVGQSVDGLDGTREVIRSQESTMGNAITDGYLYSTNQGASSVVDFAFTNGGGIRRSIVVPQNGYMTKQQLLTALPFSNYLTIVKDMSADEIKELFEHAVAKLPESAGRFLQVSGISVTYNSTLPAGSRVQSIRIGGQEIVSGGQAVISDSRYSAVTNSFLASGGDGYEALGQIPKARKIGSGQSYAQGFEQYLQDRSPIESPISGRLIDSAEQGARE